MKNIPEWVAEEIVKLRDSGHSFADIESRLRRKDFSLERHTISKVYREKKSSPGVTSSEKSPQTPKESLQTQIDRMHATFRKHAEGMKAGLENEITRERAQETMWEVGVCPCEYHENSLECSRDCKEKFQAACRRIRELEAMNDANSDTLLYRRVVLLEDALRKLGYGVKLKYYPSAGCYVYEPV